MAREISGSAVVALATTDTFAEIPINENSLGLQFDVTVNALDAFEIWLKFHTGGSYFKIAGVSADYTSPKGWMFAASGDLTVQAAASSGWVFLNGLQGVQSVLFKASGAVGSATIAYKARMDG